MSGLHGPVSWILPPPFSILPNSGTPLKLGLLTKPQLQDNVRARERENPCRIVVEGRSAVTVSMSNGVLQHQQKFATVELRLTDAGSSGGSKKCRVTQIILKHKIKKLISIECQLIGTFFPRVIGK